MLHLKTVADFFTSYRRSTATADTPAILKIKFANALRNCGSFSRLWGKNQIQQKMTNKKLRLKNMKEAITQNRRSFWISFIKKSEAYFISLKILIFRGKMIDGNVPNEKGQKREEKIYFLFSYPNLKNNIIIRNKK